MTRGTANARKRSDAAGARAQSVGASAPRSGKRHNWWRTFENGDAAAFVLPLVLVIVAIVHASALGTFFAQDDITFLARARGLAATPWSLARPLSEGLTWRLLNLLFGLSPLPYKLFNFALHLGSTALVFTIGRRLLQSRLAAAAAALLFGASSIAFTPLHWTSSLVELMACFFTLAAFQMHLVGRARQSPLWLWSGAVLGLAALLSKENAILFPLVLVVANLRLGEKTPRAALPQVIVSAAYAIGFIATLKLVHYIGSEVYSMTASPSFIANNFFTYLAWMVSFAVPIRDAVASMDPSAWRIGLPVAIAIAVAIWTQRRDQRHPEEVGLVWFLAMLAPVVALQYHSYLYYLYLPWPGMCWLIASVGRRIAAPRLRQVSLAVAASLMLFVVVEGWSVRAREHAMIGTLPQDKTMRESMLLRNVLHDLRAAGLAKGDQLAFVNPAPQRHLTLAKQEDIPTVSYIPLASVMREGETIDLFFPGVNYLGFSDTLPRAWENAKAFLYQDEGTARLLGTRGKALTELGMFAVKAKEWALAERMFLRARELGEALPDATFGLIITSDFLGHHAAARAYAKEFLEKWPDHERAPVVRQALEGTATGK